MRHFFIFQILLHLSFTSYSQDRIFLNADLEVVEQEDKKALYYTKSNPIGMSERGYYLQQVYHLNNTIAKQFETEGEVVNSAKIGSYISYFEDGTIHSKGSFKKNFKTGFWKEYYQNGHLKDNGKYIEGLKEGVWIKNFNNGKINYKYIVKYDENGFNYIRTDFINAWDSTGIQTMIDRNGSISYWNEIEQCFESGSFINGKKEGTWKGFYADSSAYYIETYENGDLISGKSWNKFNDEYSYTTLKTFAHPQKEYKKFYREFNRQFETRLLGNNFFKIPEYFYFGTVFLKFEVKVDGSLTGFEFLVHQRDEVNGAAQKTLMSFGRWVPERKRGQLVHSSYFIPINFSTTF
ncbi:hypothetical protein [Flammeovirga sp. SJP92]|uniref:hypothetical protein n=1 Tax=Flammeovirga sp. SJP92 TaxID=1775430 RepID=UPI0007883B99|nr:hypothetical protein [Flammeovirga sp. SJP92]KXX71883.1 hypothetical protein AVL50_03615 [Flammeovirga sp. SJP92]